MSDETGPLEPSADASDAADVETETAVEVHLEARYQTRNMVIWAIHQALTYLCAPILYVDFVQAALCEKLGASNTVANLPSTAFLALSAFPVIMAWLVPQVRLLKATVAWSYGLTAFMGVVVAAALLMPSSSATRIAVIVAYGAVLGCALGTAGTFGWEVLGRGVAESRRGGAFTLAFGLGPVFAVIGSLVCQLVVSGKLFGWQPSFAPAIPFPYNFALLFGGTAPIMALAAYLARLYVIPLPGVEVERKPFVSGVFGGFAQFFSHRLILIACIGYLLIYAGHMIGNNMVLYTNEAVGMRAEELVGYQSAIRFGCKVLAGFLLGWLLTRTNPRSGLFATTLLDISGVLWILFAPKRWFLLAFGLNGGGELFGVYYPNYVLSCSPKSQMRRNMAVLGLICTPVSFAPALFGFISDRWGLVSSFWVSLAILLCALLLVAVMLPKNPRPRPEDLEAADLEEETVEEEARAASA